MSEVLTFNNWLSGPSEDLVTINPKRTRKELSLDVLKVCERFSALSGTRILITTESNYSFLCLFLGIVLSGNVPVLIPQNAILKEERYALAELWVTEEDLSEILAVCPSKTPTKSDFRNSIVELYTSGSSGAPKKITKTIGQLDLEAAQTTRLLPKSEVEAVASTADSEHQYGLTFNIWLAMSHGLAIYDKRIKVPEDCSKIKVNSLLISTPSFLSNLDPALLPPPVKRVVSAGSPLTEKAASLVKNWLGCEITEIYGSTEAGVIAYRFTRDGNLSSLWTLFSDLSIIENRLVSTGRVLPSLILEDEYDFHNPRQFLLKGRKDNILKIGEERINLTNVEKTITQFYSMPCKVIPLKRNGRTLLGAVLLDPMVKEVSRLPAAKILSLRNGLKDKIPLLALPRFWRITPSWPQNNQGKILIRELRRFFDE